MAISKDKKQSQLTALETLFKEAEGIAFASFSGATVQQVQDIRRDLRSKGMSYQVIKKTLIALAAKNAGIADFNSDLLEGAVAVITSADDVVAPAAAIKHIKKESYNKETKTSVFNFAGAIFNGELLDQAHTAQLADTPSREESYAKIMAMLRSGPQKLHGVLNSGLTKMVRVLDQADSFTA